MVGERFTGGMPRDRTDELTSGWLASILVGWGSDARTMVLAGPDPVELVAGSTIHVFTSQDPGAVPQSPSRNKKLLRQLLAWIHETVPGGSWMPVTGIDAQSGHFEQGVGVLNWSRSRAVKAGTRWGQLAIYELCDKELRVISCLTDGEASSTITGVAPRKWPAEASTASIDPAMIERWWDTYQQVWPLEG